MVTKNDMIYYYTIYNLLPIGTIATAQKKPAQRYFKLIKTQRNKKELTGNSRYCFCDSDSTPKLLGKKR